ncbi:MAG: response regulator [Armatimonadota bacterium]
MTARRRAEELTAPARGSGARVLVVAAHPGVRRALIQDLEGLGYEVRTAATCDDASAALAERWPDAAVLADEPRRPNEASESRDASTT